MDASHQHGGQDSLPAAAAQGQGTSTPSSDRSASLHLPGATESCPQQAPESSEGAEVAALDQNNDADSASNWSPEVLSLISFLPWSCPP